MAHRWGLLLDPLHARAAAVAVDFAGLAAAIGATRMNDSEWTASGGPIAVRYAIVGDTLLRFNAEGTTDRWDEAEGTWRPAIDSGHGYVIRMRPDGTAGVFEESRG